MIIFYKVGHYEELIKEVQAEKETKQFIFVRDFENELIRIAKKSHFSNYFKTKNDAYCFILNEAIEKRNDLDIKLRLANNFIDEIKKLKQTL